MQPKSSIIIGVMLMTLLCFGNAYAPGGITHLAITDGELEFCHTRICQIIKENKPEFLAGMGWVDVTVPYYYTDFSNYQSTHMWIVSEECIKKAPDDKHKAVCYGIKAHLALDAAYHNYLIPSIIRKNSWGYDWLLHPLQEAMIEDYYIKNRGVTYGFMGAIDPYIPFLNDLVGKPLTKEAMTLKNVYGTTEFYSNAYGASSGSNWKYDTYKRAVGIVSNVPFLSKWIFYDVSDEQVLETHRRAKQNLNWVFKGITPPGNQNPTGSIEIRNADNYPVPVFFKMVLTVVVLIISILFTALWIIPRVFRLLVWLLRKLMGVSTTTVSVATAPINR